MVRTRRERVRLARPQAGLRDRVDELGRRAEQRHLRLVGEGEERVAVGMERRAVVEQERRARRERRHEPVPHHPAAGREVEDAIAGLHVAVQLVLLQVLQQRAAGAVDDALGHAGRAGRIEDVERMVERQRRVRERRRRDAAPTNAVPAASRRPMTRSARPSAAAAGSRRSSGADRRSCRRRGSRRRR